MEVHPGAALLLLTCGILVTGAPQVTRVIHHPTKCSNPLQRRDPTSGNCIDTGAGTEGNPCKGANMAFVTLDDLGEDVYGGCKCNNWKVLDRQLIYWPKTDSCYFMHTQGPCRRGEWFTFNRQGAGECRPNLCPGYDIDNGLYFSWPDGKCYLQGHQSHPCPEGYFLRVAEGGTYPSCVKNNRKRRTLIDATFRLLMICQSGHRRDFLGKCRRFKTFKNSRVEGLCGEGLQWHPIRQACLKV